MGPHIGAGLHGIEQPLYRSVQILMNVEVFATTRQGSRYLAELGQLLGLDDSGNGRWVHDGVRREDKYG